MGEPEADQLLVERVQAGDLRAFDLLVRRYQSRITAVISRFVKDWSECQDVAQESFIRAYRAIGHFRGDAVLTCSKDCGEYREDYLVAQKRRPPSDDVQVEDATFRCRFPDEDTATPERELMRQETTNRASTVEALPEELRTAITLREIDGLSYEEIAQAMDCPIGTVRSRIFRAREAIDEQLRPLLHDDEGG